MCCLAGVWGETVCDNTTETVAGQEKERTVQEIGAYNHWSKEQYITVKLGFHVYGYGMQMRQAAKQQIPCPVEINISTVKPVLVATCP